MQTLTDCEEELTKLLAPARGGIYAGHVFIRQSTLHKFSEGEIKMRETKHHVYLDDFEHRLLVGCLMASRNTYLQEGKPTEDVNDLILKIIEAPKKKLKVIYKEKA